MWGRFRRVVTVHDLIYARFPEAHAGLREKGMRVLVPAAARRSDRVIADSLSTRDDLVELIGISPERIDVVEKMGHLDREDALRLRDAATFYRAIDHGLRISTGHAEGRLPTSREQIGILIAVRPGPIGTVLDHHVGTNFPSGVVTFVTAAGG